MKYKILSILISHKGQYISGEVIAKQCAVSRVSISKHIKKLKEEGYMITSQTNKGYRFEHTNDILEASIIRSNVPAFYHTIETLESVDSTNDYIKIKAPQLEEGHVVIANEQTKGKGRNGKSFSSPKQKGLYMSFLLRPSLSIYDNLKITACVSVALWEAIQSIYQIDCQIKWVNDIYINHKKIAGILCEASLEMNTAQMEYLVVGVGVNVHDYVQPDHLQAIATSIETYTSFTHDRNTLASAILNAFYKHYKVYDLQQFAPIYKKHSCVLNRMIVIHEKNNVYSAFALDIDERANLVIKKEDNSICTLSSGEISILPID